MDRAGAPTRYADAQGQMIDEVEEKLLDVPLLQNLALVDTPGTNAVIQRHSQVGVEVLGRGEETWGRPYRHGTGVVCDRSAACAWSVSRFLSLDAAHEQITLSMSLSHSFLLRSLPQLTYRIVPRADVVLFLTSIARPFSESERTFLTSIAQWHKKVSGKGEDGFVFKKSPARREEGRCVRAGLRVDLPPPGHAYRWSWS